MFFIIVALLMAGVFAYLIFLRPVLRKRFPGAWVKIDEVEGWLFRNSRTYIMSRLSIVAGAVVGLHDWLASIGFDYTPLIDWVQAHVDKKWWWVIPPAGLAIYGAVLEVVKRTHDTEATDKVVVKQP